MTGHDPSCARPRDLPDDRLGDRSGAEPGDQLSAVQLAALDAVWRARRHDGIGSAVADRAEDLIRAGSVGSARKLLAEARRAGREGPAPPADGVGGGGDTG